MVICPNCGARYEKDVRFCGQCGKRIPEPVLKTPVPVKQEAAGPAAEKKPVQKKKASKKKLLPLLIAIPAVAALVVLGVIFIPKLFGGGSGSGRVRGNYLLIQDAVYPFTWKDSLLLLSKDGCVKKDFDNDLGPGMLGIDMSFFYFRDEEDTLWFGDGSKFERVAEDVKSVIPALDKTAAFLDNDGVLYLAKGSEKTKVAEDVDYLYTVSPDGKAVGYEREKKDACYQYYYDGKEHELGKNCELLALSEGGRYVYYINSKDVMYVQKGEDEESRQKIVSDYEKYCLNLDGTQILVSGEDGSYLCENGGEAVKISSSLLRPLLPMSCAEPMENSYFEEFPFVGCRDFKKAFFYQLSDGSASVYSLDKDLKTSALVRNVTMNYRFGPFLLDDGKTLLYVKNGDLYQIELGKADADSEKLIKDIGKQYYRISSDGSSLIYYDDEDECLMYLKRGEKAVSVFEDSIDDAVPAGDKGFLILSDDELFYTEGGRASRVKGIMDGDLYIADSASMLNYRNPVQKCFYVLAEWMEDNEMRLYMSTDGKNFTEIFKDEVEASPATEAAVPAPAG